jgi:galactokinase
MVTMQPPANFIEQFRTTFGADPDFVARAPGRADLIGTHVDYNEGLVLPAAISRNAWVAARPHDGRDSRIYSLDMNEQVLLDLTRLDDRLTLDGESLPEWANYAAGVAWALGEAGYDLPGCEMAVTGDVPVGAGLSSSAAVEVAYGLSWLHLMNTEIDPMRLAQICQRAENGYVGVQSGIMDQFSSACGREDSALLLDCRSLEWEAVPLRADVALVVADTSTRRTLATSKYNERYEECQLAVSSLKGVLPDIRALRDVTPAQFRQYQHLIPMPARIRARHVIEEIDRVAQAADALKQGNIETLGALMDASHVSSRDLYEASGPALDAMWQASIGHPARLGGRFLGAGWAGCLIFLVNADGADDFAAATGDRYGKATGMEPQFYVVHAAQGAEILLLNA